MKKKKKLNKRNLIVFLSMPFFAIFCLFFSIKIISYLIDNHNNRVIQKNIEKSIIINDIEDDDTLDKKYTVNFEELKKQNPDVVAFLKVNGTNIEYVVVKGNDNDYYLKHNFNKKKNVSGWIFADYNNTFDGKDKNIVIYGHNTKDGSMFGTLRNVLKSDWQKIDDNLKIMLVTEKGIDYYQVFSTYSIDPEEYYIKTSFVSNDEYENFLNILYYRSNHNYRVPVDKNDTILTLSTCMSSGTKRVVLHAKKILR